ncbi:MAG: pyridoxal-phosphate dependent enzyme [Armatimonadetes bacterium]|nr:pyridoxal-phosphate dependent enzyme [Armatimonadota bacterium]
MPVGEPGVMHTTFLCLACARVYPWDSLRRLCDCGGLLDSLNPRLFDAAQVTAEPTLWRYRHVLAEHPPVTLGEGWTPLAELRLQGRTILLKLDHLTPTGSFKDRGASLLVTRLHAAGVTAVVEDSSGNAGAALAAYAARAGMRCGIYCPASTAAAKTRQMTACGAEVVRVAGPREAAAEAVLDAAEACVYASHVFDPTYLEGTQTAAFEIAEQLGWRAPGAVVAPVGNGTLLLGLLKGFRKLREAGVIAELPVLSAARAAVRPTLAEGIAVRRPPRGEAIAAALRATAGRAVDLSETEILTAWQGLAKNGLYVEPTAATAVAAAGRLLRDGAVPPATDLVAVLTGSGLKTGEASAAVWDMAGAAPG